MNEEMNEKVVNWILEDSKDEEDDVGEGKYYFSQHSKNLEIIGQFRFDKEFLKKHNLWGELRGELDDWIIDKLAREDGYLLDWLVGTDLNIWNDGKWLENLAQELEDTYRKRITETYKCQKCGTEISEKWWRGDPRSLHRIGHGDEPNMKWEILCRSCWNESWGPKK